jgi:hypothetical protein
VWQDPVPELWERRGLAHEDHGRSRRPMHSLHFRIPYSGLVGSKKKTLPSRRATTSQLRVQRLAVGRHVIHLIGPEGVVH